MNNNIVWHNHQITKSDRAKKTSQKPFFSVFPKYSATLVEAFIPSSPFKSNWAGQTSPCSFVNNIVSTILIISSMFLPSGKSLITECLTVPSASIKNDPLSATDFKKSICNLLRFVCLNLLQVDTSLFQLPLSTGVFHAKSVKIDHQQKHQSH